MWGLKFVLLSVFLVTFAHSQYPIRHLSLFAPYRSSDWILYGNTVIEPTFVRLTSDDRSRQGGIYNKNPVFSRDWEVHIIFHVHSQAKSLFGDGFAFWYTQVPPSPGPAFGNRNIFRGLGIFFDTYANQNGAHSHEHPYVSAMVNDGTKYYDHDKDGTHTELAGCSSDFRNKEYARAIIRYAQDELKVSFQYDESGAPIECFKIPGVHLPTGYYIGFSAATGDLSDNHDIHTVQTYELAISYPPELINVDRSKIEPSAEHEAPHRERIEDIPIAPKPTRIIWTILYWVLIIGLIGGCGYWAYSYYRKRQRQLKRFY